MLHVNDAQSQRPQNANAAGKQTAATLDAFPLEFAFCGGMTLSIFQPIDATQAKELTADRRQQKAANSVADLQKKKQLRNVRAKHYKYIKIIFTNI